MAPSSWREPGSLAQLLTYFLRLGTFGFGGPIALAGRMDKDLVEERHWVSRQDYVEGLAFSQLSPGPLAAQLAMYIGWVKAGRVGAALVAIAFVAPSFLMAVAVAAVYLKFGELPWIQHMFYGVGAAVIAIIGQSAYRLSRKTIGADLFLWGLFAWVAITTVWTGSEIVWLFVLCGVLSMVVKQPPSFFAKQSMRGLALAPIGGWWLTGVQGPVTTGVLETLTLFL